MRLNVEHLKTLFEAISRLKFSIFKFFSSLMIDIVTSME